MPFFKPAAAVCILLLCLLPALAQDDGDGLLPITEDVRYTVRPSDTLDSVGALFDASPVCIAADNDLSRYAFLQIGQELLISVACPRYAEDPSYLPTSQVLIPRDVVTPADCDGVRVAGSDTGAGLARILGVTEAALREANGLAADAPLRYGACLIIPAPTDGSAGAGGGAAGTFYVVGFGDTLFSIAQQFDVSLISLQRANQITNATQLLAGTTLLIPAGAPAFGVYPATDDSAALAAGISYSVQVGETLAQIAERFDVALVALEAANGIAAGANALPGTDLVIPSGVPAFGADDAFDPDMLAGQGGGGLGAATYVVQPGDTVDRIAAQYNITRECLLETNNIPLSEARRVQPGTSLTIDAGCPPYVGYGIPPLSSAIQPAGGEGR